jgi:hypothetical protein
VSLLLLLLLLLLVLLLLFLCQCAAATAEGQSALLPTLIDLGCWRLAASPAAALALQ